MKWGRSAILFLPGLANAVLIAALALMVVCLVLFALRDRLDPLRLRSSMKGAYVYLAELLAGVLVLHVRVTMPWPRCFVDRRTLITPSPSTGRWWP